MLRAFYPLVLVLLAAAFLTGSACDRGDVENGEPDDYSDFENPGGEGPEVLFEPDADPIALLPQPNNILAREDKTTATGLRVNVPVEGPTDFLRYQREQLRKLDGFGNFNNIAVSFSEPVDLATITHDDIFLINVQRDSEHFGEFIEVDLDRGYYPKDLLRKESFFPNDELADAKDVLYAPGNRVDWYEDETNTLLIRPLYPLRQRTKYVVALTTDLRGEDGEPVRPPDYFKYVTFPQQLDAVRDAANFLASERGIPTADIAFAWEFTTATVTEPLESLRKGLYGEGPLAWLHDVLPPRITAVHDFSTEIDGDGNDKIFSAALFKQVVSIIASFIPEVGSVPLDVMIPMDNLDYIVSGTYTTASFLDSPDRLMHVDIDTGEAEWQPEEVPFFIAVPKATAEFQPPYPVAFFQHANTRNRLDIIALADYLARKGIATIGIDAAEHGPETYVSGLFYVLEGINDARLGPILDLPAELISRLLLSIFYPSIDISGMSTDELVHTLKTRTFLGAMMHGRSIDPEGIGIMISGQTFYSADIFRTVSISRQTVFDLFQGVRVLKNLGTDWNGNGVIDLEEGDFNGDGIQDVGGIDPATGEELPVYFTSMSLGSILGIPFVALEPEIKTAAFNVPGGGLSDLMMLTTVPNIKTAIIADLTGPAFAGWYDPQRGKVAVTVNNEAPDIPLTYLEFRPGARVVLENLDSGEQIEEPMRDQGEFSLALAADKGDRMRLSLIDQESGEQLDRFEWNTFVRGLGVPRNTPEARSFIDSAQWAVSQSDPISFGRYLDMEPRPGDAPKKYLVQLCSPDAAVPLPGGAAMARAMGIMDVPHIDRLIELGAFKHERVSFRNANNPIQSFTKRGWRIHPGYNHEYLLAPRYDPYSIMYSIAGREQIARFLASDGEIIEDNLQVLVPDEFLADPIDPDYVP